MGIASPHVAGGAGQKSILLHKLGLIILKNGSHGLLMSTKGRTYNLFQIKIIWNKNASLSKSSSTQNVAKLSGNLAFYDIS